MKKIELELSFVLAKVYKNLNIKNGLNLDILEKNFSFQDMIFFPQLILIGAQGHNGSNKKIRNLAVLSQLIFLSTDIHGKVDEYKTNKNGYIKNVQLPILFGDYLYSKFFEILCAEDCIEFLDYFINYITNLNQNWINYMEGAIDIEELCYSWYGNLAGLTMYLSAKASGLNSYWCNLLKKYGEEIGFIFGCEKMELQPQYYSESWEKLMIIIDNLPSGEIKEKLNNYAQKFYTNSNDKTNINNFLENKSFTTAAEI